MLKNYLNLKGNNMYFKTPYNGNIASDPDNLYYTFSLFPNDSEPKVGDDVIVVSVIYTTGDSYSLSSGNKCEVYAFTNKDNAFALMDEINKAIKNNSESRWSNTKEIDSVTVDGIKVSLGQWCGYFDYMDEVVIQKYWYIGDR